MTTFKFRTLDGEVITVTAMDEQAARAAVMQRRWGHPSLNATWECDHWEGRGLNLLEAKT